LVEKPVAGTDNFNQPMGNIQPTPLTEQEQSKLEELRRLAISLVGCQVDLVEYSPHRVWSVTIIEVKEDMKVIVTPGFPIYLQGGYSCLRAPEVRMSLKHGQSLGAPVFASRGSTVTFEALVEAKNTRDFSLDLVRELMKIGSIFLWINRKIGWDRTFRVTAVGETSFQAATSSFSKSWCSCDCGFAARVLVSDLERVLQTYHRLAETILVEREVINTVMSFLSFGKKEIK